MSKRSSRSTRKPTLEEQIVEWADMLDIEVGIVEGRYATLLEEKTKAHPDIPPKALENHVKGILKKDLKRDFGSLISKAPPVRGFLVGASELTDFIDLMRKKAERYARSEKPEEVSWAKAEGLINNDGEPLDTRENLFGTQPNPTWGLPLTDNMHSYRRVLLGVGTRKGNDYPEFMTIDYQREMAVDLEYALYQPYSWRANIYKEGVILRQRASEAATRLRPIDVEYNYLEMIEEACEIRELADIDGWHHQNESDWDRVVCARGIAAVISDQPHPVTGSTMIVMDDDSLGFEDMGHRVYVPDYHAIEFGEDTELIFWAMTNVQELRSTEEEIVVSNIYGMYPIEETKTPVGFRSGKKVSVDWGDAVDE